MADFDAVLLTGDSARKLAENMRQLDAMHDNSRLPIGTEDGLPPQQVMAYYPEWVQVTNNAQDGNGYQTGNVMLYTVNPPGWAAATACKVISDDGSVVPESGSLVASSQGWSSYYPARAWGLSVADNRTPVYMVQRIKTNGLSNTYTIVTAVSCSGGTLSVTTDTMTFTDGLLTGYT